MIVNSDHDLSDHWNPPEPGRFFHVVLFDYPPIYRQHDVEDSLALSAGAFVPVAVELSYSPDPGSYIQAKPVILSEIQLLKFF